MENQQTPHPLLGMCACDADLFERVWERVGAQERSDCPVMSIPKEQHRETPRAPTEERAILRPAPEES